MGNVKFALFLVQKTFTFYCIVGPRNSLFLIIVFSGTIEYQAELQHKNEMKRLEAELRGK